MKKKLSLRHCCIAVLLFFAVAVNRNVNAQIITTFAGTGTGGWAGDGGPATAAQLDGPAHGVFTKNGDFYFTGFTYNLVRKITPAGIITRAFGTGGGYAGDGGPASAAQFQQPNGLSMDRLGNFYVSDQFNSVIRKIDTLGIVHTFAGNHTAGYSGDGGPAVAAKINQARGALPDRKGNVYIADYLNDRIRKVDTFGIISTIAGTGVQGYSGDGGPATAAKIYHPINMEIDSVGNLYFSDQYNNRVRKIDTAGIITTFAGNGTIAYTGDGGPATAATMYYPDQIKFDKNGNLLIVDSYNHVVRRVSGATGIITTIAGTGTHGYSGDGGPATAAQLMEPWGICIDVCGNLYINDKTSNTIRKVDYFTGMPAITGADSVYVGASIALANSLPYGVWTSTSTSIATVSASGIVTGVAVGVDTIVYTTPCGVTKYVIRVKRSLGIGAEQATGSAITLYPNPNNGNFQIAASFLRVNNDDAAIMEVSDLLGKAVDRAYFSIENGSVNTSFHLKNELPGGIYFLKLRAGDAFYATKLVVKR